MPQVDLGDRGLSLRVHGPASGEAVLLLHGYPMDSTMWRFQVPALVTAGYRVFAPDLPGAGHSPVRDPVSVAAMADAVLAALRPHKAQRLHVVGFSMGGYVALDLALRFPDRVASLVLVDTRCEADSPQGREGRMNLLREMAGPTATKVLANVMVPKMLTEATRNEARLLVEEVRDMMLRQPAAGVRALMMALADRPDRRGELGAIRAPTTIVVGAEDKVTPPESAKVMQEGIRGSQLHVVDQAAHLVPMERPDALNRILVQALAQAPAATLS